MSMRIEKVRLRCEIKMSVARESDNVGMSHVQLWYSEWVVCVLDVSHSWV